jgi:hypothetical protein
LAISVTELRGGVQELRPSNPLDQVQAVEVKLVDEGKPRDAGK